MTQTANHTVKIADAYDDAVVVLPITVRKGDYVFDITGGRHKVKHVTNFNNEVRIIREDGVRSWHDYASTLTIVHGER